MTETKASWLRLKRNLRRLIVSLALMVAGKAVPATDFHTLTGLLDTIDGMDKDVDRERMAAGLPSMKER